MLFNTILVSCYKVLLLYIQFCFCQTDRKRTVIL